MLADNRTAEIIAKVNDLFEGDLTDDDQLVYVNNVIKGKLLECHVWTAPS
jgi:type I restriction enzyme R subunit